MRRRDYLNKFKNKIVIVVCIFIAIFFCLGEIVRIELGNGAAINGLDAAVGLVALIFGVYQLRLWKKSTLLKSQLFKPLVLFVGIAFLALLINARHLSLVQFSISFSYLIRYIAYATLFFAVASLSTQQKNLVKKTLVISGGIVVILGFLQYFLYPDLRNLYYLGWDEHLYRLFSTFFDPNFAAAFFVVFIFFLTGIILEQPSWSKKKILLTLLNLATFAALLLTYSRGGYLMFVISLITFLVLIRKIKYLIVALAIFALGIFLIPKNLHSEGVKLFRTASITARTQSLQEPLAIIRNYPVLGVGFNAYRYAQHTYHLRLERNWEETHSGAGTDNSYLFVLATTGVIGFAAYCFLLYTMAKGALFQFYSKKRMSGAVWLAVFAGILINSLFINSLFYPPLLLWMWVLSAFTDYT